MKILFFTFLMLVCITAGSQTGNVGIGTTTPLKPLHIVKGVGSGGVSTGQTSVLVEGDAAHYISMLAPSGLETGIVYGRPGGSIRSGIIFDGSSGMRFRTGGNTTRMLLDSVGKFGIGTSLPLQKLDVNGKIKLGDDAEAVVAGTIRWNVTNTDFEGFDGTQWYSLTGKTQINSPWPADGTYGNFTRYKFIIPTDLSHEKNFGIRMDIDSNYAVISSMRESAANSENAVYVFVKDINGIWTQQAKINSTNIIPNLGFGISVAISGDYIVVGCKKDWPHVYKRTGTTWAFESIIAEGDASASNNGGSPTGIGWELDLAGDYLVVGAELNYTERGRAYIYKRTGTAWNRVSILAPGTINSAHSHHFGSAVSIDTSAGYIAIGAEDQQDIPPTSETATGAVYVYKLTGATWNLLTRIKPTEFTNVDLNGFYIGSGFGSAVVIKYRSSLIISAGLEDHVYFYENSGDVFVYEKRIKATADRLAIHGTAVVAVGNHHKGLDPVNLPYAASTKCTVFKKISNTWGLYGVLTDPLNGDLFGAAVSIYGNEVLVGSPLFIKNSGSTMYNIGRVVSATLY